MITVNYKEKVLEIYSFRGKVHGYHGRDHGSRQAGMVPEQ